MVSQRRISELVENNQAKMSVTLEPELSWHLYQTRAGYQVLVNREGSYYLEKIGKKEYDFLLSSAPLVRELMELHVALALNPTIGQIPLRTVLKVMGKITLPHLQRGRNLAPIQRWIFFCLAANYPKEGLSTLEKITQLMELPPGSFYIQEPEQISFTKAQGHTLAQALDVASFFCTAPSGMTYEEFSARELAKTNTFPWFTWGDRRVASRSENISQSELSRFVYAFQQITRRSPKIRKYLQNLPVEEVLCGLHHGLNGTLAVMDYLSVFEVVKEAAWTLPNASNLNLLRNLITDVYGGEEHALYAYGAHCLGGEEKLLPLLASIKSLSLNLSRRGFIQLVREGGPTEDTLLAWQIALLPR